MLTHLTIASHVETNPLKNECLSSVWIISRLEYDFLFCLSGGGEEVVRDLTFRLRPMSCNMQVNDPHQSGGLVINIVCCSVWDVVTRQADWLCHAVTGGLTSPHSLPPILPNSVQVSGSHQQQDAADRECCKIYFLLLRASPTNKPSIELGVQCWMS